MIGGGPLISNIKLVLGGLLPSGLVIPKEQEHKLYPLGSLFSKLMLETGYLHIQATKPDTIGLFLLKF